MLLSVEEVEYPVKTFGKYSSSVFSIKAISIIFRYIFTNICTNVAFRISVTMIKDFGYMCSN